MCSRKYKLRFLALAGPCFTIAYILCEPRYPLMSPRAETAISRLKSILTTMGLNEYQSTALAYLLYLGEAKATILSKVSGIPSARIYGVLDELVRMGLVVSRPGRPTVYSARSPEDIAGALVSLGMKELKERLKVLEEYGKEFVEVARGVYLKGSRVKERPPLLRIVSVGEVSLEETRKLYESAKKEILIITKAFEYFPLVADSLEKAAKRGVRIRVLMVNPDRLTEESRKKQTEVLSMLRSKLGKSVEVRFFEELPLRGCLVDPHEGGKALFLVEEPGVPLFLREAAITYHWNLVKGLAIMFELMWSKAKS